MWIMSCPALNAMSIKTTPSLFLFFWFFLFPLPILRAQLFFRFHYLVYINRKSFFQASIYSFLSYCSKYNLPHSFSSNFMFLCDFLQNDIFSPVFHHVFLSFSYISVSIVWRSYNLLMGCRARYFNWFFFASF